MSRDGRVAAQGVGSGPPKQAAARVVILSVLVLILAPGAANAAFPGKNGRIAFSDFDSADVDVVGLYTVTPSGTKRRSVRDADAVSDVLTAAFSPRGGWIAWGAPFSQGPVGLFLQRANGRGKQRQLTRGVDNDPVFADDSDPAFAPDGKRIAFTRRYYPGYELRVFERGQTRVLIADAMNPSWSVRDWIAFSRPASAGAGIWAVRPDGSAPHRILDRGNAPDWSPDGRRLVFTVGGRVTIARADGGGVRRLRRGSEPAFSPDGRSIAFISPGPTGRLCTMSVAGGRLRRLASDGGNDGPLGSPAWQALPRK